jgi:hypothetical protein
MEPHSPGGWRGGFPCKWMPWGARVLVQAGGKEGGMNATWPYLRWRYLKLRKRIIYILCKKLYRDTDRDPSRSILVAGTGRSGTTWLADIINSQIPCRIMFEPFHRRQVEEFNQFNYFQYMRPTDSNDALLSYCHKVFTGDIKHKWIDAQINHIFPKYRLIKDVRVNLFLKWIHNNFPSIPLLFIVRHPCAVVQSRIEWNWEADPDIEPFLNQNELINDYLYDKIDTIKKAKTIEEKHAIIWCISNIVPIKQFQPDRINAIFYENMCIQPDIEVPKIFHMIQQGYEKSVFKSIKELSSTTRRGSALVAGGDVLTWWKKRLSSRQIRNILHVVEQFELGYLYDDSCIPLVTAL